MSQCGCPKPNPAHGRWWVGSKGSCRNFQGSLEPLEWCQMAPTSMKELSIRYMELFRTSLDTIHTYGTHVNMSISVQRSAETMPQTAISATTALLSPATPRKATHIHLQISPSTQRPTLKVGKSEPANAQTAPLKIASKAALQPACGDDQKVAAPMHKRERLRSSRPRPAAQR